MTNNKKRILIFSTAYVPFIGGAEVAIKEITDRLAGDIEFDMITVRMDSKLASVEKIGAVTVYRIGIGFLIFDKLAVPFIGALKALSLHKKHHYDMFWCMMATYASGAAYIANILRWMVGKPKIPLVLTLQEGDSEEHLTRRWGGILNLSWKLALPRTDVLTVISMYLGKRAQRLGFKGEPLLIPNGVDTVLFSTAPDTAELESLKQKLGKQSGDIFLVTTSRLTVKNAVGDVIKALPLLPNEVKFVVVGTGELEHNLKLLAKRCNVSERVLFVGATEYKHIPLYLHASDIFIRPSLSEGQGISFLEAMAAGLPIITTPVGGIVDFLFDPESNPNKPSTGLFVPVEDPKAIAKAVEQLMNDKALTKTLIKNGKELVKTQYEWDMIAEDMKKRVFNKIKSHA